MKCCAISDLHGHLPEIPDCAALFIAGDIVPLRIQRVMETSATWLDTTFREWLDALHARRISVAATWGNHDWIGQIRPDLVPDLPWCLLVDEHKYIAETVSTYGSPWQPEFGNWAFNLPDTADGLGEKWKQIPEGLDVLLLHGPPKGVCDTAYPDGKPLGGRTLGKHLRLMSGPPRVVLFGHIHGGYGQQEHHAMRFYNVAVCNEQYQPANPVTEFEL